MICLIVHITGRGLWMVVDTSGLGVQVQYGGLLSLEALSVQVQVCVHVQFSNIFDNSREAFVDQFRAAWPARWHVGIVDSEINVELWWIGYLFIHIVLWWSACCCGTTGVSCDHIGQEGCLGETYCHVTVMQTCFPVKPSSCCIDMETCCGGRLGKGIGESWGDGERSL